MSSASKIASLIATADKLRQSPGAPLRGRNLALLHARAEGASRNSPLQGAAEELGARVALLNFAHPPSPTEASSDVVALARMLGRMYDGIDCHDLDAAVLRSIELHAGVPVFPGLALDTHPARVIADLWALCERQTPAERRIVFIGNGRRPRARMFVAAARTMGVAILAKSRADPGSEGASAIADASQPRHWVLWIDGTAIDRDAVQENHRRIMQAILVHTLVGA
ncbi:hypothetical protein [Variovorax sp. YR216]|uniref:hypothetical protein n=1 Tax=Variovorax sp. YR216 TaxID=1882828 RepID=UPI00089A4B92|nr:hypothetical protein [Variovorax sp. YR216]SEA55138.1 Aspartate/ornithine carbamoyltransferase, carbamoyl-P binding domain [Variovorax sp. YR216]